jgi:molecular chaperone DnaJ
LSKRDYYDVLGVSRQATDADIKSAYRKLALKHHPDRNPGDRVAEEKFKEAAEAYAVLADREKRAAYDRFGHAAVGGATGPGSVDPTIFADFGDILGGLGDLFGFGFGDAFGGRRRGGPQRGADLRYDLEIAFDEAAGGVETAIQIPREEACDACGGSGTAPGAVPEKCPQCRGQGQVRYQQGFFTVARTCGQCRGSGRILTRPCVSCRGATRIARDRKLTVKIPAGIASGQRLRLAGEGEGGYAGGPPGDLYVVVHVQDHPFFHREGDDLYCEVPASFPILALGGEIQVPTLEGSEPLQIPAGTQAGARFRIRGKGLRNVGGHGRGDLYVAVSVAIPKKLTREQRELIAELGESLPTPEPDLRQPRSDAGDRPFFDRVRDIFG